MERFLDDKFYITLVAFVIVAIAEFIIRGGGGFTIAAFIFHGIYKLAIAIGYFIDEDQKRQHEN